MTEVLFPVGYGMEEVTLDVLFARHGSKMHPEFRRRTRAMIADAGGLVGIGGGWRSSITQAANYARSPQTFAPPGDSFHEYQLFASGLRAYQALDFVGTDVDDDGTRESVEHRAAWQWLAINAHRFGIVMFGDVNGEAWHGQCRILDRSGVQLNSVAKWKRAGSPDPDPSFVLPGVESAPPAPAPAPSEVRFVHATVSNGDVNADVFALQVILRHRAGQTGVACDGVFDARTDAGVRNVQGFCKLTVDGIVGPKTWAVLDGLANS